MLNSLQISEWQAFKSGAGEFERPPETLQNQQALSFRAPSTLAAAILANGEGKSALENLDYFDWWLTAEFFLDADERDGLVCLSCEGLATLGEVWLNGESLACFNNMFLPLKLNVKGKLKEKNSLIIVIRSTQSYLAIKRSRPAWRTNLVENQNLRWLRSSLLGYIPSWAPDIKPLGIYRSISLESEKQSFLNALSIHSKFKENQGELRVVGEYRSECNINELRFTFLEKEYRIAVKNQNGILTVDEKIVFEKVQAWWPHTHGEPHLYDWSMRIDEGSCVRHGRVGFKSVSITRDQGKVEFRINEVPVFVRGGCWTTSNLVSLTEERDNLRAKLQVLKKANMNAIRIGGTMLYESEEFYSLCDELGILVWQDFMFANMDYPIEDENFLCNITAEADFQTRRLSRFVSVSVYCGGSEVEQQAAMMGVPQGQWRNEFFAEHLPEICSKNHNGIPYFPSSPCEGDLPFYPSSGIAHYFGVGAYQQDFNDLIKSDVKFASECLAFSNVPSEKHLVHHFGHANPAPTSPKWKRGVPRDNAVGWDFEDVRDFYFQKLSGIDPVQLRYEDLEKYHKLSRIVSGYVIARTFLYWRSTQSDCSGGLVWFLNDIFPGAGWGLIDSDGESKPALDIVGHVFEKYQCYVVNKGLEGHDFGIINESPDTLSCTLRVMLISQNSITAEYKHTVEVGAWGEERISLAALRGSFVDSAHFYRFGSEKYQAIAAQLFNQESDLVSQDIDFPCGLPASADADDNISAEIFRTESEEIYLQFSSDKPLYYINITSNSFSAEKNWFHLLPGRPVKIPITIHDLAASKLRMTLQALNRDDGVRLLVPFS